MARTALPRPLLFLLRAGVLLAVAATAVVAAQTEFPYAAGTDAAGRGRAVSDAAGRVLIESPEFPRGLWVDFADEAGQAVAGIQVDYEGRPDSLVVIWAADPSGLRQETLLWTRPGGDPLSLSLKSGEPADLPAGLTSIDWRLDPSVEGLLEASRLVGWEAVAAFLRNSWRGQDGMVAVRLDDSSIAVDMDQAEAVEIIVGHLRQTHQPVSESPSETPVFRAAVYQSGNLLRPSGVVLQTEWFKDENLEAAVREAMDLRHRPMTGQEVASLTLLEAQERNIHSLSGVGHLTGLDTLDLHGNEIVDVGPLAPLTNLERLQLRGNEIVDVSPLAALTSLKSLGLFGNRIVDVSPLAALTNLQMLYLGWNSIVDVSPLAGLTSLKSLGLSANEFVDLGPLASLTGLESLGLSYIGNVDVSPLAVLTSLERLWLNDNEIVDVSPLATLTNLEQLYVPGNEIVDLNPLISLTNLRSLWLSQNDIFDVSPLAALTNLLVLVLDYNEIVDLSPLATLTNLQVLRLTSNEVANTGLGGWDEVFLEGNPLSDLARNEQIPALRARGVKVTY